MEANGFNEIKKINNISSQAIIVDCYIVLFISIISSPTFNPDLCAGLSSKTSLIKVIRGHVSIESIIHTDGWRGYNGLVDVGYSKHLRVQHGHNEFANGNRHINGIESFWSYAKRRLVKFNGVSRETFFLHLKETEFRFNNRSKNLYKILLTMLRKKPI